MRAAVFVPAAEYAKRNLWRAQGADHKALAAALATFLPGK
jgi:hypothetical protein